MTKLFNENLGVASNSKQLAALKKKFNFYHPTYVAIATMATRPEFRNWLESIWKQYEPYADSNFPNEFKKQFNQRSWELHIGATLLNRGHNLQTHKDTGPDFKILHNNCTVWIEAIAVEKGAGKDRVPEIEYGKAMDVPEKEMLFRLTAGLKEKHQKYLSYLKSGHINSSDPYIIAIDRSPLEHMDAQIPLILKCLFAIGHQVLFLKRTTPHSMSEGSTWTLRDKLNKVSGSEVEMLMFRDSSYEGISAVIYCPWDILNSSREPDKLGSNFVIVHNPYAKNSLPDNFFKFGEAWKQIGTQIQKIKF